jgi:hypothetical protein
MSEQDRKVSEWRKLAEKWWLFPLVLVASAAFMVFLLALGSRGSDIATVLSLPVAILTALLALRAELRQRREDEKAAESGGGTNGGSNRARRPTSTLRRRAWLLIAAAVGAVSAGLYWFLGGQDDLNVTSDVGVSRGSDLADGARVELVDRGRDSGLFSPPQRDNLAVKFSLHNTSQTGYCVGLAEVRFLVAVDGEPVNPNEPAGSARSGGEVVLDLSEATRSASVIALVSMEDKECRVDLRLDRVTLYN